MNQNENNITYVHEEDDEKINHLPLGIYIYHYDKSKLHVFLHVRHKGSISPISKTKNIQDLPYRIIKNVIIYK